MWLRFTERARKVVFYAQEEAQKRRCDYVSTEHILLGLLHEKEGIAIRVLEHLSVDIDSMRLGVEGKIKSSKRVSAIHISLSPNAKKVIDFANEESDWLGNNYIGTEHILLGLIRGDDGITGSEFSRLGITLVDAQKAVVELQNSGHVSSPAGTPDQWVKPIVLQGITVRLEPLRMHHAGQLAVACDDEMFSLFPTFPTSFDEKGLSNYIAKRVTTPDNLSFAIVHQSTGVAIGSSSMYDFKQEHKSLEIGHTWIKKEHRGTRVNPEIKLLMLTNAFEVLGCNRVQLKTDSRNLQSQAAMKKLGATREGTLRNHMIMPDGFVRDSVYFSIIASDWPQVKQGLLNRLSR